MHQAPGNHEANTEPWQADELAPTRRATEGRRAGNTGKAHGEDQPICDHAAASYADRAACHNAASIGVPTTWLQDTFNGDNTGMLV